MAASFTASLSAVIAIVRSSLAIRSCAFSMRALAAALTCFAAPPWNQQTVLPRISCVLTSLAGLLVGDAPTGRLGVLFPVSRPSSFIVRGVISSNGVVSRITYLFDPDGEGTVLTFTQEGLADQTDADHHEHGWRETLAKLSDVLEETGGMHE
jgi:hypothetical protein